MLFEPILPARGTQQGHDPPSPTKPPGCSPSSGHLQHGEVEVRVQDVGDGPTATHGLEEPQRPHALVRSLMNLQRELPPAINPLLIMGRVLTVLLSPVSPPGSSL